MNQPKPPSDAVFRHIRGDGVHPRTLYIAGSSKELPRVRDAISMVDRSLSLTFDWVPGIEAHGGDDVDARTPLDRRANAFQDIDAVLRADALWLLIPRDDTPSKGAWVELGAALGAAIAVTQRYQSSYRPRLIVSSYAIGYDKEIDPLFVTMGRVFISDDEAGAYLRRRALPAGPRDFR